MFSLTKPEKGVIVFLAASFILGCGLVYFKKTNTKFCLLSPAGDQEANSAIICSVRKNAVVRNDILSNGVNLNKAGEEELIQLPGIGCILAKRIIDYRKHHGYFTKLDDIKKVTGIGNRKFERIKEHLALK
ncbi:MAG: helix-hairpin-helix domain-containing protein [Candidatus Omnitrophota bacterium]|nr:helix-hairpin-helix domain-containing protein [Candidatus Omnitrophota bacterium]